MVSAFISFPPSRPLRPSPAFHPFLPRTCLHPSHPVRRTSVSAFGAGNARMLVTEEDLRPSVGFTMYSERLNGRAAMLGFVVAVAIELVTGRGVVDMLLAVAGGA